MELTLSRPRSLPRPGTIDAARFHEGLLALFAEMADEIAADPAACRQRYTSLVLEAASGAEDDEDARAFAQHFSNKGAPYTSSRNGLSALLLESWLLAHGGKLFAQFVETVLDPNSRTYTATFLDKILSEEEERMQTETAKFVGAWDNLVRAGDKDYEGGRISEVTVYNCAAGTNSGKEVGGLKPTTAKMQTVVPPMSGPPGSRTEPGSTYREDLLPRTRSEYEQVIAEGGLSSTALVTVFGRNPFSDMGADGALFVVEDSNGIAWTSADRGETWLPRLRSVVEFVPAPQRAAPPVRARRVTSAGPVSQASLRTAALRSPYESWAVFESPVDGEPSSTIVSVCDGAWAVPALLSEVEAAVTRIRETYAGLPAEGDVMVEAFLREYAEDRGRALVNAADVLRWVGLDEARMDRRDAAVSTTYLREEGAAPPKEKKAPPKAGPPAPPPPPPKPNADDVDADEPATTDRKERPPFYRDDLQRYFDLQKALDKDDHDALVAVRRKFKLKASHELEVTPAGEVRATGIVDDPEAPKPAAPTVPPPGGAPLPPSALPPEGEAEAGTAPPEPEKEATSSTKVSASTTGGVTTVKASRTSSATESLAGVVPVQSLDAAFVFFVTHVEDAYLDDFPYWVREHAPHLADGLDSWKPVERSLQESREDVDMIRALFRGGTSDVRLRSRPRATERAKDRAARRLSDSERERHERWGRLANAKLAAVLTFHTSEAFAKAFTREEDRQLARQSATMLARMKATPVEEWDDELWNWCGRQMKFIARLRSASGGLIEHGALTHKYLALRAWGHDPATRTFLPIEEVEAATDVQALHRRIDELGGPAPHPLEDGAPAFGMLRKHKVDLSDDERAAVLRAGAVWHPTHSKSPHSAVWKAQVGERTWYVVNTHRAYKTAETLAGAIKHYPAIKKTA